MLGRLPSALVNAESSPQHATDWYVRHLLADVELFGIVLDTGPLDAPIAACAGWDVARLAEHLGQIHRWARFCVTHGRPPSDQEAAGLESFDRSNAAAWLRNGASELASALRELVPDGPTWHPFPVSRVGRVWPRRQAHETAIHRWDAERAIGLESTLDAELSSDGIDEYFEVAVPRLVVRERIQLPSGSLHVHCTDVDGEWLVSTDDSGAYQLVRVHQKGDAALRGPAEAILLRLWGREGERSGEHGPDGDTSVLDAWHAIAGM